MKKLIFSLIMAIYSSSSIAVSCGIGYEENSKGYCEVDKEYLKEICNSTFNNFIKPYAEFLDNEGLFWDEFVQAFKSGYSGLTPEQNKAFIELLPTVKKVFFKKGEELDSSKSMKKKWFKYCKEDKLFILNDLNGY
ncbi:hypothetical protein [Avibacterium avium]|uniref:hypothetical protein n=1 Tax=Avibacterium avium TaxID=751 RepID=UPI003BF80C20